MFFFFFLIIKWNKNFWKHSNTGKNTFFVWRGNNRFFSWVGGGGDGVIINVKYLYIKRWTVGNSRQMQTLLLLFINFFFP